jgi:hypothetical protein
MDTSSYLWYIKVEGILQLTLKTNKMAKISKRQQRLDAIKKTNSIAESKVDLNLNTSKKELVRFDMDTLKIRVVKDGTMNNVEFISSTMGKPNKDGSYNFADIKTKKVKPKGEIIQAAVEIIIPEKCNNKKFVDEFSRETGKAWFIQVMGNSWFKADKDTDFEKKGDNVIEVYGIMNTEIIQKHIDIFNKRINKNK